LLAARSLLSPRRCYRKRLRLRRTASGRSFAYNLRLPGQYYQAETGLSQNTYRDYDPAVGRYVESDPLLVMTSAQRSRIAAALRQTLGPAPSSSSSGTNWRFARGYIALYQPYSYATDNPLGYMDPLGLEPEALCDKFSGLTHGLCSVCVKAVCEVSGARIACCAVSKDECMGNASADETKQKACMVQYGECIGGGPGKKPPSQPTDP
jgi:RHS repeat-associated protein